MQDLDTLKAAVQGNCHISDAQFAGQHSLCVFLLKMREYFRWERGYGYADSLPREAVGDWLVERERLWETLGERPYAPLSWAGSDYDPFDVAPLNDALLAEGYVYGAGYGQWCKPHFFLAHLREVARDDGLTLLVCDGELARDLVAPPAMTQGGVVYVRRDAIRRMLWEKVDEWRWRKQDGPMPHAMAAYGFDDDLEAALERMTDAETRTVTLHEMGEHRAGALLGESWRGMVMGLARSRAELLARAVKDHLADCLSTLPGLIAAENIASLHFFHSNLRGMRRQLFPKLLTAFEAWHEHGRLEPLDAAVAAGRSHWQQTAQRMLAAYRADPEHHAAAIEAMEADIVL
jgi:hypothetical protein